AKAAAAFSRALERRPNQARALLGLARIKLDQGRPSEALPLLQRARAATPLLNAASYYEGKAYERLGRLGRAADAYARAVSGDSYFLEGREALGRVDLRRHAYADAYKQLSKLLAARPYDGALRRLLDSLRPTPKRRPTSWKLGALRQAIPYLAASPPAPGSPLIRVGLDTDSLGRPKPRRQARVTANTAFNALDAATGRIVLSGRAGEIWTLRLKKRRGKPLVALIDAEGRTAALSRRGYLLEPRSPSLGVLALDPASGPDGDQAGRLLRGRLEATLFGRGLRLVDIVDIENYVNGVLAAEMPARSPLEALKAQAVLARTNALFLKKVARPHRRYGYDVCDRQHCQVYAGARVESARSRAVVERTRGIVVTYKGRLAHVIYSANCGGRTQSGRDVAGWGDVPYWVGVADSARPQDISSPWALRHWLRSWPGAFCQPSADVPPSHFRWTRIVSWRALQARLNRALGIGRLRAVRALKRSPSGNVDSVLIVGSRRSRIIDSELAIRDDLAPGSLRSTLFAIDYEYDRRGRPSALVFNGGGWGHGVGLCQSGAIGRAEAGQTYGQIIKAYFKGVELRRLDY
ncbi:MAG: SpoIID/LytB domain-containing protein, partial [Elusimicrobia bacterium]|nr:SpoIID/LytB domain-containing protein [Elusimicrobiota bacterium]